MTLCIFASLRLCTGFTFPDHLYAMLFAQFCILVPDGLALLLNNLDPLWFPPELWVRVVIWEAHLLHLSTHVFFAMCIDWVVEWDDSVVQSSLIVSRVHIHVVDIEGVLHEAFICR